MRLTLHIWRQKGPQDSGRMVRYEVSGISPDMSFLEMLDLLNEQQIEKGEEPVAFDHDCREGICGACSLVINGVPHGPEAATTTCQLHMRHFRDGAQIHIEPFRANAFPNIRDLVVDRNAFDRIIQAGGYVSTNAGSAPDGNAMPISQENSLRAFDAAACIGCGACVASCKNASASLFTAAKVAHLQILPQGHAEREKRVFAMIEQMDEEGFGNCTNQYECEAACPKDVPVEFIALMNREYIRASVKDRTS